MDEKTTKMIKERFDALPKMIQEVIISSHYEESLIEIGKQYNLNVGQMGMLEQETTLVMMGLTLTKDFQAELTRELNVDKLKGSQIVKDINEKIFLKIRELLKLMNTPAGEEPSPEETGGAQIKINRVDSMIPKKYTTPQDTTEKKKNDTQVLNSAGIEIIGEKPKDDIHPMLAQKLSSSFQIPSVKTEHAPENLSSSNVLKVAPKVDPYREIPE